MNFQALTYISLPTIVVDCLGLVNSVSKRKRGVFMLPSLKNVNGISSLGYPGLFFLMLKPQDLAAS
jgi:hypothetical protein